MNRSLFLRLACALACTAVLAPAHARTDAAPRAVTPRGPLGAEEQNNIAVFKAASPSVVNITSLGLERELFSRNVQQVPQGTGTGFVWDAQGHIVTNFHVIQGASGARVTLADQSHYAAKLVGVFPDRDLAVLKIDAPAAQLRPLPIGRSADLQVGQAVYAIGNPFGLDQTLTTGIVSALNREIESVFGLGVLGGVALGGGWWMARMWQTFGNPVFPQFNSIFRSPLAPENGVIDVFFRPQGWQENLLWPFIFTLNTRRVSEIPLKLAVWPLLYVTLAALAVAWLVRRPRTTAPAAAARPALAPRTLLLLLFVALGYLVWMRMFSIYRYLVPLELLAPLTIWLAWQYISPRLQRLAGWALALLVLTALPAANWGHAGWAEHAFSAQVPAIARPADSIVFFVQPDPPSGWMATFLPPQTQVIALGTGMPETPAWRARQQAAIAARPGPHYVLLSAARNDRDGTRLRKLAVAQLLGLTDDAAGCDKLERLMGKVRLQVELRRLPAGGCTFDLLPQHRVDLAAQDRAAIARAAARVRDYGLTLDQASCTAQPAAVGTEPRPFLWCRVAAHD